MTTLIWIIFSGVVLALISLVGALALVLTKTRFEKIVEFLVAFAAGALISGAFFHLIPEAIEGMGNNLPVYLWIVGGIVGFGVLEQYIHWHHCHLPPGEHKEPFSYLILVADTVHNLIDGLAVGASFLVGTGAGIATTLAVVAHEIPQELGDFGILIHGGWEKSKAIWFNFFSSITFLAGALLIYFLRTNTNPFFLLAFAAGSFIYIAAVDIIPEISRECTPRQKVTRYSFFVLGIVLFLLMKLLIGS